MLLQFVFNFCTVLCFRQKSMLLDEMLEVLLPMDSKYLSLVQFILFYFLSCLRKLYPCVKIWCFQNILISIWLMFYFSFIASSSSLCHMKFWGLQNILRVCMAITRPDDYRPFWILILVTQLFFSPVHLQGKTEEGKRRAKRCKKNQTIKWCRLRLWRWSWFALATAARQVSLLMSSLRTNYCFFFIRVNVCRLIVNKKHIWLL